MIEIIYKEEKKEANGNEAVFRLPRNIRQIGEGKSYLKIYMEDYVYTYLKKITREEPKEGKGTILFGKYNWKDGVSYVFIQSAMFVKEMEPAKEHITLNEEVWRMVEEKKKEYFSEQEVVGWSLYLPEGDGGISDTILHTHLDHFAGNDKIFFFYHPGEKEETFYTYENGQMVSSEGYYIYYEKNEPMQNFMIDQNKNRSIESEEAVPDRAVNHFRQTITEKNEEKTDEKQRIPVRKMMYRTGLGLAVTVLALGITMMNRYEEMQETVDQVFEKREKPMEPLDVSVGTMKKEISYISGEESEKKECNGSVEPQQEQHLEKEEADPDPEPENIEEASVTVEPQTYIVQKGDTLSQISAKRYGTVAMVEQICTLNQMTAEDIIYEGQELKMP